jgi:hypothetical protein
MPDQPPRVKPAGVENRPAQKIDEVRRPTLAMQARIEQLHKRLRKRR